MLVTVYKEETGSEGKRNLSKVTQLMGGETETQTQMCWSQGFFRGQSQPCLQLKPQEKRAGELQTRIQVLSSQELQTCFLISSSIDLFCGPDWVALWVGHCPAD